MADLDALIAEAERLASVLTYEPRPDDLVAASDALLACAGELRLCVGREQQLREALRDARELNAAYWEGQVPAPINCDVCGEERYQYVVAEDEGRVCLSCADRMLSASSATPTVTVIDADEYEDAVKNPDPRWVEFVKEADAYLDSSATPEGKR